MKKKPRKLSSVKECPKIIFLSSLLLILTFASYGQWSHTNLSEGKNWIGATSLGTKAYFAGGQSSGTNSSKVEIYDAEGGEWDTILNLSVPRAAADVVACDGKVYFAGGDFEDSTIEIFDPQKGEWTFDSLSVGRALMGAVSNDSIVIFAGGFTDFLDTAVDTVDIYNTKSGIRSGARLSEARDGRAAVVVGDLAIFAGGWNGQSVSNRIDIYNFSTELWSIDSLSVARGFMAVTAVGNKALFAGGMTNGNLPTNLVDIYDADTDTWSTATLSTPRAFLGSINAATVCDKAYIVGGGRIDLNSGNFPWTTTSTVIDIFNSTNSTWEVDYLANGLVNHAVVGVDSFLIIAGGNSSSGVKIFKDTICNPVTSSTFSLNHKYDCNIYPNPATGALNVDVSFKNITSGYITLYNILGHQSHKHMFFDNSLHHQIDLDSFSPGIYFLEIRTDSGRYVENVIIIE